MPRCVPPPRNISLLTSRTRSRVPRSRAGSSRPSSSPDRQADFFTLTARAFPRNLRAPLSPQAPKPDSVAGEQKVVTTELIQKYLNENEQLILAILENQNVGKLQECAQYQARLQQNLMYLAAIADATPKQ